MSNTGKSHSPQYRMFPTEYLLRAVLSHAHYSIATTDLQKKKVLDIGCLYSNNLVPFHERGCEVFGIEVNEEMVHLAKQSAELWKINAAISRGTNSSIPFADIFFDLVLSINTIHYEDSKEGICRALSEFARVGKPGCQYVISTPGPEHIYLKTAERLGENQYRLNTNEFRNGQIMAYFDNKEHFVETLQEFFPHVEVATITEDWIRDPLQYLVAKCAK